jgi:cyclopropane-fatty-acyl-phospholipid synthase
MELEKISTWEDYLLIQPWLNLFFSFNGPISDYNLPLRIVLWNGRAIDLGEFKQPKMTVRLKGWSSLWLLLRPNLNAVGEAYMKGDIDIEGDLGRTSN